MPIRTLLFNPIYLLVAFAAPLLVAQATTPSDAYSQANNVQLLTAQGAAVQVQTAHSSAVQGPTINGPTETIVVVGTAAPIPLAESTGSVLVIPVDSSVLVLDSPQALLRSDPSVFIEQRGAGGGQADLILRGGTFEQSLILLNGFRINDSQTSHHNLDLPIPLDALDSVQILHGAGSTLHGADALSGVADFITAAPSHSSLRLRAGAGSYWENEQSLLGELARRNLSARLTASRNFSEGFITDRDYRNEDGSFEGWGSSRFGMTDLMFAASDRAFGAAKFYGNYPEWERTKSWFAAIRQDLGSHTVASFAYRRHTDQFILVRKNPSLYENNHIDGSWQSSLRQTVSVASGSLLLFGVEADGDSIHSNALGKHAENRGSGYIDLDLRPANKRWNLSAGVREELFSGGLGSVFSPHLAASLRLTQRLKLRASGGYGYRIPTYTDRYYRDPVTHPNPLLKPESAWSGEGGFDWTTDRHWSLSATAFYTRQHDTIDYVRPSSSSPWTAVNLNGIHFQGVESFLAWTPNSSNAVRIGWTALPGQQSSLHGLESEYAYNYPTENITASWTTTIGRWLTVANTLRIAKIYQQSGVAPWNSTAYPVWNATLNHDRGRVRPYLRFDNLSNTGYQEIRGVPMQGRSIVGGVALWLQR